MNNVIVATVLGMALMSLAYAAWRMRRTRTGNGGTGLSTATYTSIEGLRSIGELSVFKVFTKEIVTASDHAFGEIGRRYLEWMISSKKMAMIFEFDIDFRYNLKSANFEIRNQGAGRFLLRMPECFYETHIKGVHFYDEQNSRLLPWLLPDLLTKAFGSGFSEKDKNRLIEEAKLQASKQARDLVHEMRSDVRHSAGQTLRVLAEGFGAHEVQIEFQDEEPKQAKVEFPGAGVRDQQPADH